MGDSIQTSITGQLIGSIENRADQEKVMKNDECMHDMMAFVPMGFFVSILFFHKNGLRTLFMCMAVRCQLF